MTKELHRRVLDLCVKDHVGLASLLVHFGDANEGGVRRAALAVLKQLLMDGLVRAGRPTPDGKAFVAWDLGAADAFARIEREWLALGRAPAPGDIAWFAATKEGVRVAAGR